MYQLLKQEGRARRGEFTTVHGTVQTPAFMNVATSAAIKGGISSLDLRELRCQVELCNTYHLHIRPGDRVIRELGGLHRFTGWNSPIRQRRLPGLLFVQPPEDTGGGGHLQLPCGRQAHLYGAGGEYAHPVQPGLHHCHGLR